MFNMTFLIFYGSHRHVWRGIGAPAVDDKVHILELCCGEKVSVLLAGENGASCFRSHHFAGIRDCRGISSGEPIRLTI